MLSDIINVIKGTYVLKVEGRYPERLFNIASSKGIYLYDIQKCEDGSTTLSVSKKGGKLLLSLVPENLTVTILSKYGLPFFLFRYRYRIVLFLLPVLFLISATVFSSFIWNVEISGGNEKTYPKVLSELKKNGVYVGAVKNKISQYDVKRNCLLNIDNLSWIWVDIKGTTAHVTLHEKTEAPSIIKIDEPSDVYAQESGVIESIQTYCGIPLVENGQVVQKGQMLITGVFKSENENIPTYFHHATGKVIARVWKEKEVNIPKKTLIKVPTGRKRSSFGIKIKKNKINFSINSGISYTEYDKIEKEIKLFLLPVHLFKTTYLEVSIKSLDNDINKSIETSLNEFKKSLMKDGADIKDVKITKTDEGDFYRVKFVSESLMRIDKEIPINKDDYYGENN